MKKLMGVKKVIHIDLIIYLHYFSSDLQLIAYLVNARQYRPLVLTLNHLHILLILLFDLWHLFFRVALHVQQMLLLEDCDDLLNTLLRI